MRPDKDIRRDDGSGSRIDAPSRNDALDRRSGSGTPRLASVLIKRVSLVGIVRRLR